ncbi:MAG: sigma-70 family RNA polymerase sigma factor [Planctomycetes bacterium]|nr:sigma-70 family RNA polymerase sigma factor [Planctomycetota bacterium]
MPSSPESFPPTLWTTILAARDRQSPEYRDRMNRLISRYWKPAYWVLRSRWNRPHEDARDLTQAFFAGLLERDWLATVQPDKGRFRSWLRVVLDNFMRNELEAAQALKRGGGARTLSLDAVDPDPPVEAAGLSPEQVFDRAWAIHVFHETVEDLRDLYRREGRAEWIPVFERHELDRDPPSAAQLAQEMGKKQHEVENALKAARVAFAKLLRARVKETIGEGASVEEELKALAEALR